MLLAPLLPMSSSSTPCRRSARLPSPARAVDLARLDSQRRWLLGVWLILGSLAVLCIAPLRGGVSSGWTLPFWLIAAPLINLSALLWERRRARRQRG